MYEGEWHDGKQHGQGIFIKVDGTKRIGVWENGRNVKWLDDVDADQFKLGVPQMY